MEFTGPVKAASVRRNRRKAVFLRHYRLVKRAECHTALPEALVASFLPSLVEIPATVALASTDVDLDATVPGSITLIVANIHDNLDRFLLCRRLGAETLNLTLALRFQFGVMREASE